MKKSRSEWTQDSGLIGFGNPDRWGRGRSWMAQLLKQCLIQCPFGIVEFGEPSKNGGGSISPDS